MAQRTITHAETRSQAEAHAPRMVGELFRTTEENNEVNDYECMVCGTTVRWHRDKAAKLKRCGCSNVGKPELKPSVFHANAADCSGRTSGLLTATRQWRRVRRYGLAIVEWLCRCRCGKQAWVGGYSLNGYSRTTCGCVMYSRKGPTENNRPHIRSVAVRAAMGSRPAALLPHGPFRPSPTKPDDWEWFGQCACGQEKWFKLDRLRGTDGKTCSCILTMSNAEFAGVVAKLKRFPKVPTYSRPKDVKAATYRSDYFKKAEAVYLRWRRLQAAQDRPRETAALGGPDSQSVHP